MKESFVLIFLLKVGITMRIVCKCYTSDLSASFLFAGEKEPMCAKSISPLVPRRRRLALGCGQYLRGR